MKKLRSSVFPKATTTQLINNRTITLRGVEVITELRYRLID